MQGKKGKFDYGYYHDARTECVKKFGSIFDLPIIDDPHAEMIRNYKEGNVLDLGAGKYKPLLVWVKDHLKNGKYYSLDNDPEGEFDFNEFDSIPKDLKFSLITANQFFEHLDVEEALDFMTKVSDKLEKGGVIIATVPNIAHPNRQAADITHKTAWGYHSFYTVFKFAGLEVTKIARYSKVHPKGYIQRKITDYMRVIYRMDWCDSILVIGQKK